MVVSTPKQTGSLQVYVDRFSSISQGAPLRNQNTLRCILTWYLSTHQDAQSHGKTKGEVDRQEGSVRASAQHRLCNRPAAKHLCRGEREEALSVECKSLWLLSFLLRWRGASSKVFIQFDRDPFCVFEDANIISPFLDLGPFLRNQKESNRGGKKQTNSLFATAKAQAASDLEW